MTDPTTAPDGLRRRLGDARAAVVGTSGLRARVTRHATALAKLRESVDRLRERVQKQDARLAAVEGAVSDFQRATALSTVERERRDTHFGTMEVRLADLEQRVHDARASGGQADSPDAEALAAGRSLLEEIRVEHARIRARMQVVSAYEERLRRVEESVAELFEGDARHPV